MAIALWSVETFPQVRGQWRTSPSRSGVWRHFLSPEEISSGERAVARGGARALECGDISSGERAWRN